MSYQPEIVGATYYWRTLYILRIKIKQPPSSLDMNSVQFQ